jgi:biopolymer transport protein ExbD
MAIGKLPDVGDELDESDGESIFAEINITPLTDVFLVMVIIFMVSALAVVHERNKEKQQHQKKEEQAEIEQKTGLKVNLPQGPIQEIDTTKPSLVLTVPINGDVQIAGKSVTDDEIDRLFRNAFVRDKSTQVVLKADKAVAHGRVVNLMERAKAAGLQHIAIATGAT